MKRFIDTNYGVAFITTMVIGLILVMFSIFDKASAEIGPYAEISPNLICSYYTSPKDIPDLIERLSENPNVEILDLQENYEGYDYYILASTKLADGSIVTIETRFRKGTVCHFLKSRVKSQEATR